MAPSVIDRFNSTIQPLGADETFLGEWTDIGAEGNVSVLINGDVSASGILSFEFTIDRIVVDFREDFTVPDITDTEVFIRLVVGTYFRVRYLNGPTPLASFRLQTQKNKDKNVKFENIADILREQKEVRWKTDTDFNKGTNSDTEVLGVGNAAIVQLVEVANNDDDIPYAVAGNYTPSDGSKIEVDSGQAKLVSSGGTFTNFPFTIPSNYTISDITKLQVLGGKALLRVTNILGHWQLNESSGSAVSDSSGKGNDGTAVNMEDGDWVAGKLNNALLFGGTDEFVNLGAIADFERTDSFSFELWFKTTTSAAEMILAKGLNSGPTFRGWNLFIESGKIKFALISDNTATNKLSISTDGTFNNGELRHLVVTYDGSSTAAGVTIYIDGSAVATTVNTNNLSATISNAANCQISGRDGANLVFNGTVDEVVIYEEEISSSIVTSRFNSGTGTETLFGSYPTDNPNIINNTGFVFATELDVFTETATKIDSEIKYHISSDDGVTWKYWNGSAWVVTDDTFTQANLASVINTNISALASSGTFKFRALLHSNDGSDTPELDNILVSGVVVYSTDDNLFVDTKDAAQIAPAVMLAWLVAVITNSIPANTDIRILFSVDGRVSWLTWSGSAWVAPASATTRTDATSITDAQNNFASLPVGSGTLDVRVFLRTTDSSETPNISNINVTSDTGFSTSGTHESNIFDSTFTALAWKQITFKATVPTNTTLAIKVRVSIDGVTFEAYTVALLNGEFLAVIGKFIQWKADLAGNGAVSPSIDRVSLFYDTPLVEVVTP